MRLIGTIAIEEPIRTHRVCCGRILYECNECTVKSLCSASQGPNAVDPTVIGWTEIHSSRILSWKATLCELYNNSDPRVNLFYICMFPDRDANFEVTCYKR